MMPSRVRRKLGQWPGKPIGLETTPGVAPVLGDGKAHLRPLGGVEGPVGQFDHVRLGIQPDAAVVDVSHLPRLPAVVADPNGPGAGLGQFPVQAQDQPPAGELVNGALE